MEDVTGFNQKNADNDGEKMVEKCLHKLKQRYSDHIIEIIRLMLKFEESQRPSFVELGKLVLTSNDGTLESPKGGNPHIQNKQIQDNKVVSKAFSHGNMQQNRDNYQSGSGDFDSKAQPTNQSQQVQMINHRGDQSKNQVLNQVSGASEDAF